MNAPKKTVEEKRFAKVAKLLRQAEDVKGTPEEFAFKEKAFELAARYGVSTERVLQYLADGDLDAAQTSGSYNRQVTLTGSYRAAQAVLVGSLAEALHCFAVQHGSAAVVTVVGVQEHVDRVVDLWEVLGPLALEQVEKRAHQWRRFYTRTQLQRWRQSFLYGFAVEVRERLERLEEEVARQAGALVLFKSDRERAEEGLLELYPDVQREVEPVTDVDTVAFLEGRASASEAELATRRL
ncbi:hypothetical protein SEA_GHOBES_49 [Gordonia phage Ghobes]|uniref:Uncharacterized protein n=1 Tax=Gordonia phage Ghobes TaxID=1887647 RepID=A0A1B3B049_9CAUD|nr:hypothetical protein KCH37_gp49 [Gordonia phage Ghobes]AOE44400.1 hypothetical protein SEA_GHOBES_49 [Gordonia phage Ghobes]